MGIFQLLLEFRPFGGPRSQSRDSSTFGEKICMCIYTLRLQVEGNLSSMIQPRSCLSFYPESLSLELGGVLFRNCLESWAYVCFMDLAK